MVWKGSIFWCCAIALVQAVSVLHVSEKADDVLISKDNSVRNVSKVCMTRDCIHTAALLLRNMDLSVDPCDNFYDFACGGFSQTHYPRTTPLVFVDTLLDDRMKAQLRRLLMQPKLEAEPIAIHKLKDYFASCIDEASMKSIGLRPLTEFIDAHGGWPVVKGDEWDEENFSWVNFTTGLAWDGVTPAISILGLSLFRNFHYYVDREFIMLHLHRPFSFEVSGEPMNSTVETNSYKYMVDVAVIFGASRERAEQEMKEVWEFANDYKTLAETPPGVQNCNCTEECQDNCTIWSPLPNGDSPTNPEHGDTAKFITIADLYNVTDEVDWLEYIRAGISPNVDLNTTVMFRHDDPSTFKNITEMIAATPKRVFANYLFWVAVKDRINFIRDHNLTQLMEKYEKRTGQQHRWKQLRWLVCLQEVHEYFRHPLTTLYSRNYLKAGEKRHVTEMYDRLRTTFQETLDQSHWLSKETVEKAKQKLTELTAYIAYPVELESDEALDHYYEPIVVKPKGYFENYMAITKFAMNQEANLIGTLFNASHWANLESILDTNAFYYHMTNSISIPATQVRGIYFSQHRVKSVNYGSLGSIIGHEVLHGFNELGITQESNKRVNRWWKPEDAATFRNRSECIIKQYWRFGGRKIGPLNGTQTLDENVADNAGVTVSYETYQRWVKETGGVEASLPGLKYTPNQLFWIAFGNSWCSATSRPLSQGFRQSLHSPPKFRVLGTIANMEHFSRDFNCPESSPMNPKTKCRVW